MRAFIIIIIKELFVSIATFIGVDFSCYASTNVRFEDILSLLFGGKITLKSQINLRVCSKFYKREKRVPFLLFCPSFTVQSMKAGMVGLRTTAFKKKKTLKTVNVNLSARL